MHINYYNEIIQKLGPPTFYDQHGHPRYAEMHPDNVTIYQDIVGFFMIRCQSCHKLFNVSHVYADAYQMIKYAESFGGPPSVALNKDRTPEAKAAYEKWIDSFDNIPDPHHYHYGDPPAHGCVGDTMNSIPVKCLGIWAKFNETDERDGHNIIIKFGEWNIAEGTKDLDLYEVE